MTNQITVSYIEYYGRETFRPECETSRLFAKLLNQKTLTRENIETIKQLGYSIKLKALRI